MLEAAHRTNHFTHTNLSPGAALCNTKGASLAGGREYGTVTDCAAHLLYNGNRHCIPKITKSYSIFCTCNFCKVLHRVYNSD